MYKATVIINTYNEDRDTLRKAIESYVCQKGVDIQILISTVIHDDAILVAREYNIESIVSLSPGIYSQLNCSLSHIQNDWYAYASGNDIAKPNKMFDEIDKCVSSNKKVCYSAFDVINKVTGTEITRRFHDYNHTKHMKGNFVNDCATIHKSLIEKYGPFDGRWGNHGYYDFWLRIYEGEGNVFVYNDNPTWDYIIRESSSHQKRSKDSTKVMENLMLKKEMLNYHGKEI